MSYNMCITTLINTFYAKRTIALHRIDPLVRHYQINGMFQILQAEYNKPLEDISSSPECGELFEHSGCTAILTVCLSIHNVLMYSAGE